MAGASQPPPASPSGWAGQPTTVMAPPAPPRAPPPTGLGAGVAFTGVGVACLWKALISNHEYFAEIGLGPLASLGSWAAGSGVDAVIPAVILSVVVLVVVSLGTPPPTEEQRNAF